mmetsp:Transcript_36395/g.56928  ORF Transcript_36395/g.56928 Transcript_36395/m.56928 type:complete len:154 (+) Transcript_36395:227-688(+)
MVWPPQSQVLFESLLAFGLGVRAFADRHLERKTEGSSSDQSQTCHLWLLLHRSEASGSTWAWCPPRPPSRGRRGGGRGESKEPACVETPGIADRKAGATDVHPGQKYGRTDDNQNQTTLLLSALEIKKSSSTSDDRFTGDGKKNAREGSDEDD